MNHLVSMKDLTEKEIIEFLNTAEMFKENGTMNCLGNIQSAICFLNRVHERK